MKKLENLIILFIVFQLSQEIYGDKIKVINLPTWNLANENGTIHVNNLNAPVGVYSALKDLYGSVLDSKNDDNLRWIAYDNWTFSTIFSGSFDNEQKVNLTLHGIDTISIVYFNGYEIGKTDNMFTRYSFDVLPYMKAENILEIKIISPVLAAKALAQNFKENGTNTPPDCPNSYENGECHRNMLRKMQASFGGRETIAVPSMGIWKPVDLEYHEAAIMRDIDVALRHNDTHWTLDMRIYLSSDIKKIFYCEVTFIAVELLDHPLVFRREVSYKSLEIDFKVNIPKEKIKLWWPNGYGEQKLYPLHFISNCWLDRSGPKLKSKTKSEKTFDIGFRTIELQEDLDDFGRAFYFKVNGQPIFVKGANYVPSHVLPEYSYRANQLHHILNAAKETHLNMIRVWGGGLYESDAFYDLADAYGLLVWQDLAFTSATYPFTETFMESVRKEISQNAKRIAFHPSLCMLVTNDEIELYLTRNKTEFGMDSGRLEEEYKQMFRENIRHELNVISRDDFNPRAGPMVSTPSMGVEESKRNTSTQPQSPNYGDVHFWENEKDGWDPDIYPRARFFTEYGFQSLPALASWNRTLYGNDRYQDILTHREHNPQGFALMLKLISTHFAWQISDWENDIEDLIYLSQLSQAMAIKTATDVFRAHRIHKRTMGALYWQLNDNWVAPTSSSIDYFGNYKIVWNWSKEFMAPTSIIALMDKKNSKINVTVTKEEHVGEIQRPEIYNITMYTFLWSELFQRRSISWEISVGANGINTDFLDTQTLFNKPFTRDNCFFKFVLTQFNKTISSTFLIPGIISNADGITNPQLTYGLSSRYCLEKSTDYIQYHTITITIQSPAIFVYLEVFHPDVERYKLSENGIIITEPIKVVQLEIKAKTSKCITLTKDHVRLKTINELLFSDTNDYTTKSVETLPTASSGVEVTSTEKYRETGDIRNDIVTLVEFATE